VNCGLASSPTVLQSYWVMNGKVVRYCRAVACTKYWIWPKKNARNHAGDACDTAEQGTASLASPSAEVRGRFQYDDAAVLCKDR